MPNEPPTKKLLWGIVIGFVLIGIQWQVFKELALTQMVAGKSERNDLETLVERVDRLANVIAQLPPPRKTAAEEILLAYSSSSTRQEDDLHAMAHVFSNLRLLVKGDAPFRMGANEEFAAALLGKNAAKEVFLSTPHACLNEKGQIIDRWGSALFFHVRDAQRIDIRSAGPDRVMWTADDLHRTHEGEFVRGEKLPEPRHP
ncbi:MAG: hypothetical protein HS117_19675 [Verrucomicrobiaceae bacterium]|nr:hypothetical protein [Verrucomicrobiaceae bacterium]